MYTNSVINETFACLANMTSDYVNILINEMLHINADRMVVVLAILRQHTPCIY